MNHYSRLASACINNIRSGLAGYKHNPSLDRLQVEDELIWTRQKLIKTYLIKGNLDIKEILNSIRCINVDCLPIERCPCGLDPCGDELPHFEIPQVFTDLSVGSSVYYIGPTDMSDPFLWFTNVTTMKYSIYSRRGQKKARVFIDTTPNKNNMFDCFIFNAPLVKQVTVQAVFKDPRQMYEFGCCDDTFETDDLTTNMSFLDRECMDYIINKYIVYYRQMQQTQLPNDQSINRP